MGGLVSGVFDLFGGDPAKSEENALGSLAGFQNNLGEKSTSQGLGWEGDILSGDPTKIAQALAPEIKAGQQQVQQQAEQNAFFGNRGGGTNSSTNAAQSGERGNIINLIGDLQQGAAGALTGAGENLMGQGSSNLVNEANLAEQWRQQQDQAIGGIAGGIGQIASGLMSKGSRGGGMDPGIFSSLMQAGTVQPASLEVPTDLFSPSEIAIQ